jgi:hypothetical protein
MEREDEGQRTVETGCRGGQGSPRAVVPSGRHLLLSIMQTQHFILNVLQSHLIFIKNVIKITFAVYLLHVLASQGHHQATVN